MSGYPVSIKGVVLQQGRILLLRNEREQWELPGGRLELGETPQECVAREITEETGWAVTDGPVLDAWMYHIAPASRDVFIVTYGCQLLSGQASAAVVVSHERSRAALFTAAEVRAS